jgi:pSer/pThr/pTyr-binding forkhead associated (FHA) protein
MIGRRMPQRPARPSDAPTRALGDTSGGVDSRDLCLLLSYADGVSVIGLGERKELVLGRAATCDVVVPDDSVSRRHARLVVGDEGIFLEDLGSVNGTTVDGEKIRAATALRIGAAFELGKTTVLLQRSEGLTRHSKHTIPPGAAAAPV